MDLANSAIEVRTEPEAGNYRQLRTVRPGEDLAATAFPDAKIAVAQLLG